MDLTLLHPKVVHLPIALAVLMPLVTVGIGLSWRAGWLERRAWAVALALQAVLALSSIAAGMTGEVDEERVERVVPEEAIEAHEEAAELFTGLAVASLLVFVLPLGLRSERFARAAVLLASLSSIALLGLGWRVGERGGALVYEHQAASAFTQSSQGPAIPHDDDHDD